MQILVACQVGPCHGTARAGNDECGVSKSHMRDMLAAYCTSHAGIALHAACRACVPGAGPPVTSSKMQSLGGCNSSAVDTRECMCTRATPSMLMQLTRKGRPSPCWVHVHMCLSTKYVSLRCHAHAHMHCVQACAHCMAWLALPGISTWQEAGVGQHADSRAAVTWGRYGEGEQGSTKPYEPVQPILKDRNLLVGLYAVALPRFLCGHSHEQQLVRLVVLGWVSTVQAAPVYTCYDVVVAVAAGAPS